MKKSFIIASIVALGGLSALQTACDNYDDLVPQEYNCILSLQKYGEQDIILYRTGNNTDYEITTLKTGNVPTSVATAVVKAMTEAEFADYQQITGKDYKYLPQECYSIQQGDLSYSADDKFKKSKVSINYEKTEQYFNGTDQYVIPVLLASQKDSCLSTRCELVLKISDMIVPSIGFESTEITFSEDMVGDETITLEVPVVMPVDNLWNFSFEVEVDASLAAGYVLAKEEAYEIEAVDFVSGENAVVKLVIDKSKLDFGSQAIPLKITSCDYESFEVSSSNDAAVVTFYKTVERSELADITVADDKITGYGWATSNGTHTGSSYDGIGKAALFDNDLSSLWHGSYRNGYNDSTYGQYIDFELPEEVNHFAYDLWTRAQNANGAPRTTDVYASTDGATWTKLKTISSPSLTQGGQKFESSVCSSTTPFTHIRFAVITSAAGNVRSSNKYWNCAEMKLYAK